MKREKPPMEIPEKIWELLRRNAKFRRVVERLAKLDQQHRAFQLRHDTDTFDHAAYRDSVRLVQQVNETNPYAGLALQWLVPDPLYITSVEAKKRGGYEVIHEWQSRSPDPVPSRSQLRRRQSSTAVLTHRGPEIHRRLSRTGRLRDAFNSFAECRAYKAKRGAFTLEHCWEESPLPFRRALEFLCEGKARSHVSDFFQRWNPIDLLRLDPGGRHLASIPPDIAARLLEFNELRDFHIFAIPKHWHSKGEFKASINRLRDDFVRQLPGKRQLLGTPKAWEDWLGVMNLESSQRMSRNRAVLAWIEKRHHTSIRKPQEGESGRAAFRTTRQAYEGGIRSNLALMDQLCSWVYPVFQREKLLSAASPKDRVRVRGKLK